VAREATMIAAIAAVRKKAVNFSELSLFILEGVYFMKPIS
jgi:hypothetical protein